MRLVLDTNIVVAAMRSPRGASAELLRLALRGEITLLGTMSLALEYIDVLNRPDSRAGTDIDAAEANRFAEEATALLSPVEVRFSWRPLSPDPGDDHVLEAALNGAADALVTFNLADLAAPARAFGLPALTPGDILRRLEQSRERP